MKQIVQALGLPALLIGTDERVLALNSAAETLVGTGHAGRHYITVLRQPALLDMIERSLADGSAREASYLSTTHGHDNTWAVHIGVIDDETGRMILLTFEDLSAIEEAGAMRRNFVSNVSHELRTPLTAVLGFVETLRGAARSDPQAQQRFLAIIDREAQRMAQLVDDLLSLSRVEEEERRRPTDPVELTSLIDSVVDALAPLAAASNVILDVQAAKREHVVSGDKNQLGQVLTNLIENAIKYGGENKVVTVTLSDSAPEPSLRADGMRITVTDQGEGIPEHHIPRLTERFYRLDSHRSRELGGTGLGLAIVKHIINRHRGRLRITSTVGQGSSFTVILPVNAP